MRQEKFNERYELQDGTVYKVDANGKIDKSGSKYLVLDKLEDGYLLTSIQPDPSQPSGVVYIENKYFLELAQMSGDK